MRKVVLSTPIQASGSARQSIEFFLDLRAIVFSNGFSLPCD